MEGYQDHMNEMVVGFPFDSKSEHVLLIEKKRPIWQKDHINGIGGRMESGETPFQAMVREFKEETGQMVESFKNFAIINGSGWRVYFFNTTVCPLVIYENPTDEKLLIVEVKKLPKNTLFNLNWLIPMALDPDLLKPVIIYDTTVHKGDVKIKIWDD